MNRFAGVLTLVLLAATLSPAQPAKSEAYAFAAASVKPSQPPQNGSFSCGFHGLRFEGHNVVLLTVIARAYDMPFLQGARVTGWPEWLRTDRFDIDATADHDTIPAGLPDGVRRERLRGMLRALLADRFQLVLRKDVKEVPVYAMKIAKGGLKLAKSAMDETTCDDSCHGVGGGGAFGFHGTAAALSDLAKYASNWTDRPVVYQTGVKDLFQIDTKPWNIAESNGPTVGQTGGEAPELAGLPPLATALAAVGLKLERTKAPLEWYTVERASKPSAN